MPTRKKPSSEGSRTSERVCIRKDAFTLELAFFIWKELTRLLQSRPHLVICHVHRKKVDVNRTLEIGTANNKRAKEVWDQYHSFICDAKSKTLANHKKGILFDIHGHGHAEPFVELGYGVNPQYLISESPFNSCIAALSKRSNATGKELIIGSESLGAMFQSNGYSALPSPDHPNPTKYKYYFGGHTVISWGSMEGGELDAIQIELPKYIRQNFEAEASRISCALHDFVKLHYQ